MDHEAGHPCDNEDGTAGEKQGLRAVVGISVDPQVKEEYAQADRQKDYGYEIYAKDQSYNETDQGPCDWSVKISNYC